MQGFRNYIIENQQRDGQQIVVDLMPPQYAKPSTPPPSPPRTGLFFCLTIFDSKTEKALEND